MIVVAGGVTEAEETEMTETVGARSTRSNGAKDNKEDDRALQEVRRRRGNHPEGGTPLDCGAEQPGTKLKPARRSW
jgi:hypothetical protein